MPLLTVDRLTDLVRRIFIAAETPEDIADIVARSLVLSDLVGHESHGVVRVRQYLDTMRRGDINPAARPTVIHEMGATVTVDAHRGFGQLAARWTMEQALDRAKAHGIAAAGLVNCGHVGRLGEWVELAADQHALALAFCNGGGASGAGCALWRRRTRPRHQPHRRGHPAGRAARRPRLSPPAPWPKAKYVSPVIAASRFPKAGY